MTNPHVFLSLNEVIGSQVRKRNVRNTLSANGPGARVTLIADPELRIVPRYHGAHKRQRLDYWRGGLWRLHGISPFDQRIHRRNRS